ncbi:MAG: prohibitin family protein [Deltaproteobacteria bacterium]|nr:prohibitin family protein [Deltaproteobacteria bacterium]
MKRLKRRIRFHVAANFPAYVVSVLLLLFFIVYFWPRIFITVHAGQSGVLYKRFFGGTVVDRVYGEGFHIIFPWNIMTVYDVRYQVAPHQMEVLTNKGLKVGVTMSIRYRPETEILGVLHQVVGPDYLKKVVIPEVEAVLRTVLGRYDAEEIYTTQKGVIQQVVNEALEQVSQRFVKIDDVVITAVELPPKIRAAIEAKLEEQQLAEAYVFKLEREKSEAERKRIEASGIRDYNRMIEASLSEKVLKWKGVEATRELAQSPNAKIVVIGGGKDGLPVILDTR